jgi:protoporphyrinogen oxidase
VSFYLFVYLFFLLCVGFILEDEEMQQLAPQPHSSIQEFFQEKLGEEVWNNVASEILTLRKYGENMENVTLDKVSSFMKSLKQKNEWGTIKDTI